MNTQSVKTPAKSGRTTPVGGGYRRDNDIRWTRDEWNDMARLGALRIAKVGTSIPLGEVLNAVQKSALPSLRWKPLDELSNAIAQTKFYAACKRCGYTIAERPPRQAGVKPVNEQIRWTERESLLVLRRYLHLEKAVPGLSATERMSQCQSIELPEDRRYMRRGTLSAMVTHWAQRFEPLKNNLWLLDNVPFIASAKTYEEANGIAAKVTTPPPAAPAPDPAAFIETKASEALQTLAQTLPPLPPPVSPAALAAPIAPPSGAGLDGLASGIAGALNAYIADRDAAITAHVMQSIASGPIANAIAAHIVHSLAATIADAVNTVVGQVVPRIVAAELAASVSHISTATGPIQGPAAPAPVPEAEPPPVVEAKPVQAVQPVEVVRAVKGPKHNPEPTPTPGIVKKLRIDLVGTERMGAVRAVMGHLNGAGRYVDLHPISQDQSNYRPNKGTPVIVFNGFSGHDIQDRIKSAGGDLHLCGKGMLAAAATIKKILTERGYLAA